MRRRQFGDDGIKFDAGKGANRPRRRLAVAAGEHCGVLGHVAPPNRRLERLPKGLDTSVAAGESEVQVPRTRPAYPEEFRPRGDQAGPARGQASASAREGSGDLYVTLRNWLKAEKAERGGARAA